jgi:hypothetical protein
MTLYARIDPNTGAIESRDLAIAPPAARGWLLLSIVAAPAVSAGQVAELSIQIAAGAATQVWTIRAKTQAELDAADDAADIAALRAQTVITLLKAEVAGTSALTAAQFRTLVARILLVLVRRVVGGG